MRSEATGAKPHLLIRADADASIGAGHVMRCLALAQAWQDAGGEATFACARIAPLLAERVREEGCGLVEADVIAGRADDLNWTKDIAYTYCSNCIIMDGYGFEADYQFGLCHPCWKTLIVDDDGTRSAYCADFVLNHNAHASKDLYAGKAGAAELLLGTGYCLLRREYSDYRAWTRKVRRTCRNLLVTLGGADEIRLTERVVTALTATAAAGMDVRVIVGPANARIESVRAAAKQSKGIQVLESQRSLLPHLLWADVAITAGGSTCWELAYMGVPCVVLLSAANQKGIPERLEEAGAGRYVGSAAAPWAERAAVDAVCQLGSYSVRREMSAAGRRLVDGAGASRVVSALMGVRDLSDTCGREVS